MKKANAVFSRVYAILFITAIASSCTQNASINPKYDIASAEFEELSEKHMRHIANFELMVFSLITTARRLSRPPKRISYL